MSCALCEWQYMDPYGEYAGCVINGPYGDGCSGFELATELRDDSCPQIDVARQILRECE
ncbi:MAG: hypothetical protein IKF14_18265 [Atopobiaceae bacterium]|nr:hypothetical protein [Atopobiaceae bacterium]MBR3161034.1 hypothetical protein [Atopobiaceae bacterium]